MMRFKRSLLVAALTIVALLLTACGTASASRALPDNVQPTTIDVGITPDGDRFLLVGTLEHGTFVSFNDGEEWTQSEGLESQVPNRRPGVAVLDLAVTPDGRVAFAATSGGLYTSADSGRSWTRVTDAGGKQRVFTAAFQVSVAPDYHDTGFIVTRVMGPNFGETVFHSTDFGITWSPSNLGRPYPDVQALSESRIAVATGRSAEIHSTDSHDPSTLLLESDRAVARITVAPGFDENEVLFAGGGFTSWSTVKRVDHASGDVKDTGLYIDGPIWRDNLMMELTGSGGYGSIRHLGDAAVLSPYFLIDGTGFVISTRGLAHTTDSGLTWELIDGLPPDSEPIEAVAFSPDFADSQLVYAVTQRRLLKSTDGGTTWQAFPSLDELPPIPTNPPEPTSTPGPSPAPPPTATAAPNPPS